MRSLRIYSSLVCCFSEVRTNGKVYSILIFSERRRQLFLFIAFLAICTLVFSGKRKDYYEKAAMLPFADDATAANSKEVAVDKENEE